MDIFWPGDEYGHGAYVYMVETRDTIRLVQKLDEPGHYLVEDGSLYIEKKTARGITQQIVHQELRTPTGIEEENTMARQVANEIARWIKKNKQTPTVLHISCDDLMTVAMERREIAQDGNAWGLTISLLPKGEKLSVDRRIEL
jgi:hypothetical protein